MAENLVEKPFELLIAVKSMIQDDIALRQGALIAKAVQARTTLLKVISHQSQIAKAEQELAQAEELLAPLPVNRLIRVGIPPKEIIQESKRGSYDLMVVGESPLNLFMEAFLTHTVERVIRGMACPVLVARPLSRPLHRILLCEGGQSTSLLPTVTGPLAPLMRCAEKVMVLHVMSQITARPGIQGWELRATAEELIDQQTPEGTRLIYVLEVLHPLNLDLDVKVRHGLVVEEILAEAQTGDYDLIIVGHSMLRGLQRFLVDDPVHKLIIHGEHPILVI